MAGLTRKMARPTKQAQPLTPEIMIDLLTFLDLNKRSDLAFWGILVVGFFAMLRKSNLVPDSLKTFDAQRQLTRGHISFKDGVGFVKIMWAKNIQFRERVMNTPVFFHTEFPPVPCTCAQGAPQGKRKEVRPIVRTRT